MGSQAWEKWQQVYADLKFANRMGGGAIRRMMNRKLSMAWEQWQQRCQDMREQRAAMRRAVLRMIYRKLSMAFNAWAEWYADMLEQERRLRRALYSWHGNGMMWAFTWWRTGRFENVLDLHSKAAAFWLNREMGMAWRTWHEKYCKFKEMRDLLARLEARHQREKEALLQEIERLRKLIMDRELKRQADWDDDDRKLAHALKMMQNRALAAAFNKLKYEAQMARENNGAIGHVLKHWLNRAIAAAWNSWIAMIDEMNRQRDAMYNSVKRWQNQLMFGAFNTWRVGLAMAIHEKNTMLRAILRWGGSELLVSFEYWRETAMKIRVAELEFRAYLTKSYDQS